MPDVRRRLEKGRPSRPLALRVRLGVGPPAVKPWDKDYDFDRDSSDRRVIAWVGGAIVFMSLLVLALKIAARIL